ncbi:MAG: AraC family transcriptional regulator [Xanthobacteraceae bacterium]|nr:AraC family transcriptional regulator [Xanthobacteraceae bacterium]
MRTRNLDEAIDAVSKVYCPHTVEVMGPIGEVDAFLEVNHPTSQPLVSLSYSVPVKIDAQNFSRLFLMMGCASGAAATTQERRSAEWGKGQTMPFSAGFETQLWFDRAFVQRSVRLDTDRLEVQCARWLGRPLDEPLRFALRPFSDELERLWRRTLAYLWSSEDGGLPLAGAAKAAFDEYLLTLLLHHHPHNYSEEMAERDSGLIPGVVRRAERYISDNAAAPITVSDVAAHLGISLRTLQAGFRQWRNTTPRAHLQQVRLQLVRDELLRSGPEANVTAIAMRHGFVHLGRFSAQYRATFGEPPSATLRRGRAGSGLSSRAVR